MTPSDPHENLLPVHPVADQPEDEQYREGLHDRQVVRVESARAEDQAQRGLAALDCTSPPKWIVNIRQTQGPVKNHIRYMAIGFIPTTTNGMAQRRRVQLEGAATSITA